MSAARRSGLIWLWLTIAIVILDQVSKWLILVDFRDFEVRPLLPFLNFTLAYNTGAAFSFLSDESGWQRWFFIAIAIGISGLLLWWLHKTARQHKLQAMGFAMILGGAAGNVLDRLFQGHVIDFIDFHIGAWHWYTFNVADIAITIGAFCLLLDIIPCPCRKRAKS